MAKPTEFPASIVKALTKLKFKKAPASWLTKNEKLIKFTGITDIYLPPTDAGEVVFAAVTYKGSYPYQIGGENGNKHYLHEKDFIKELTGIVKTDDWFFNESAVTNIMPFKTFLNEATNVEFTHMVPDTYKLITKEQLEKMDWMDGGHYISIEFVGPSVAITHMKGNRYDVWRSIKNNGNGGWYRAGWDLKKAGNSNAKLIEHNKKIDKQITALYTKQNEIQKAMDKLKAAKV